MSDSFYYTLGAIIFIILLVLCSCERGKYE
jgi:hypothetical protein